MLIINADDWGRSREETETALHGFRLGRITSVTAMVFMADSERAAEIALKERVPTGLHLNFTESFSEPAPPSLKKDHERVVRFLKCNRYGQLLYNPFLRGAFRNVVQGQLDEFMRLYGMPPTHFDGHQHMHLCMNMLALMPIPKGQKVRRSFSFAPGEKSALNRFYRAWVVRRLASRYHVTDYFFALSQQMTNESISRVCHLAVESEIELMTHPIVARELSFLSSESFGDCLNQLAKGSYRELRTSTAESTF